MVFLILPEFGSESSSLFETMKAEEICASPSSFQSTIQKAKRHKKTKNKKKQEKVRSTE